MSFKSSFVFVFALLAFSCSPEKKAQKEFKYAKYERVIKYYKGILNKQPNNPKANYFASSRANSKIYEASGTPFTDLYQVDTKGANVDVGTLKALPEGINANDVNTGSITFSADGKLMIFARGNTGKKKGAKDVDLFLSRFRNGAWTAAVPIKINTPDYWESTPSLSPDGRTLYFSSNRKGRFGGLYLYSAQMDSRCRF